MANYPNTRPVTRAGIVKAHLAAQCTENGRSCDCTSRYLAAED